MTSSCGEQTRAALWEDALSLWITPDGDHVADPTSCSLGGCRGHQVLLQQSLSLRVSDLEAEVVNARVPEMPGAGEICVVVTGARKLVRDVDVQLVSVVTTPTTIPSTRKPVPPVTLSPMLPVEGESVTKSGNPLQCSSAPSVSNGLTNDGCELNSTRKDRKWRPVNLPSTRYSGWRAWECARCRAQLRAPAPRLARRAPCPHVARVAAVWRVGRRAASGQQMSAHQSCGCR